MSKAKYTHKESPCQVCGKLTPSCEIFTYKSKCENCWVDVHCLTQSERDKERRRKRKEEEKLRMQKIKYTIFEE